MPYTRKRTTRRKTVRRKRPAKKRITKIPRYVASTRQRNYPTNRVVTLTYADHAEFNYGALQSSQVFWVRANGLWDPDPGLGGHSAMGLTEWANFFKEYTVVSSSITARFLSNSAANVPRVHGISIEDGETFPAIVNCTTFQEQSTCKWRMQQIVTNGNTVVIRNNYNATKWHGIQDIADADDQRVAVTTDPALKNAVFYRIASYVHDDTLPGAAIIWCSFRITYKVMFNDQTVMDASGSLISSAEKRRRRDRFLSLCQQKGFVLSEYDPESTDDKTELSEPETDDDIESTDIETSSDEE